MPTIDFLFVLYYSAAHATARSSYFPSVLSIESNYLHDGKNRVNGALSANSGGNILRQDAILEISTPRWQVGMGAQVPIMPVTTIGQTDFYPLGGGNTQLTGPPIRRLDFSVFKSFLVTKSKRIEFRAESFNLTNTPTCAMPGSLNFLDTVKFARIRSTRDAPNDARELQFALKFYW